ncbi:MAG: YgiT-type zinc finger protein [Deltaproteobacteria bacterium]|nr:YgiT-type zinc finger protein [Deltaproteobacteria bacterium]
MKCHDCGANLKHVVTDLPFKQRADSIVILKKLPVLQCENCAQFLIENATMEQVDRLLGKMDKTAELEVVPFRADPHPVI